MHPLHSQSPSFCSYFYSVVNWIQWKDPMNASLWMKQGFSLTKKVQCSGSPSNPWMFACSYSPRPSTEMTILNEGMHGVWPRHPGGRCPLLPGAGDHCLRYRWKAWHCIEMWCWGQMNHFTLILRLHSHFVLILLGGKSCYISCVNLVCIIVWNFILNTKMKVKTINCDLANN